MCVYFFITGIKEYALAIDKGMLTFPICVSRDVIEHVKSALESSGIPTSELDENAVGHDVSIRILK